MSVSSTGRISQPVGSHGITQIDVAFERSTDSGRSIVAEGSARGRAFDLDTLVQELSEELGTPEA